MNRAQLIRARLEAAVPVLRALWSLYVRTVVRVHLAAIVGAGRAMARELSHAAASARTDVGLPSHLAEEASGEIQGVVVRIDAVVVWAARKLDGEFR